MIVPSPGSLSPVGELLAMAPGWRVLPDPARGTLVFLHVWGCWVEVAEPWFRSQPSVQIPALAEALRAAASAGLSGEWLLGAIAPRGGSLPVYRARQADQT